MKLAKKIQDALNEQINHELYSAYLYLSMSEYCQANNFSGTAKWLRMQWAEEQAHALRLADYINRRNGRVVLEAIAKPAAEFGTLLKLFEQVLKHEESVSARINKLYEMAQAGKDHATAAELQWFITEQVEEEENATHIIEMLKLIGDNRQGLFMLDRQLGERKG
jgi:ferritin